MRVSTVRRLLGVAMALALGAFAVAAEPRESVSRASVPPATDLPRRTPGLTLYFFDVHQELDGEFDELAAETRAIFAEMGVEVAWRRGGLGTTYGMGDSLEIPIIVLQVPPKGIASKANVLGLVPRNAPGSKAVWIFAESIRFALAPPSLGFPREPVRGLGVAAGRVVAHEVVHALAPSLPHTREGLMRHSLSRLALIGPARAVQDRWVTAVQAALAIRPGGPAAVATESALLSRAPIY